MMKIVLNVQSSELISDFIKLSKNDTNEIINAKVEKMLFDSISVGDVNVFVIENSTRYSQKAIDFIKKKHPYIPIIVIGTENINTLNDADIYIPYVSNHSYFYSLIIKNILTYQNNFQTLQRLTAKIKDKILFGPCVYDPNKRTIHYKNKEIAKLSEKAGGIIEMLASNYGKLVKKELILESVWLKSDYFSSRSMDVYVTNLRKIFKENNINIRIKNISKAGLILE